LLTRIPAVFLGSNLNTFHAAPISKEKVNLASNNVSPTLVGEHSPVNRNSFQPSQFPNNGNPSELPPAEGMFHSLGIHQLDTTPNSYTGMPPGYEPVAVSHEFAVIPPGAGLPPSSFVSQVEYQG
jgi:hypothetical protein